MTTADDRPRTALVLLALVLSVLATYARVGSFEFVGYDDPDYVLTNPLVNTGFSWAALRAAFTSAHASNWHPLTWLAHMLDVELYGLAPAGHHWSSVVLHALNAALCFLALRALTGRFWPSACVAALFALHPLRVESVAWVSERKDVLSGTCFFLLLAAYARHARAPGGWRYAAVLLAFALGLLAKPMLVTAPFLLLLLDVWPLGRLAGKPGDGGGTRRLFPLVMEKLPLFLLAALSVLATLWSQSAGGSVYSLEALPLAERLANAPLAVLGYLRAFLWPSGLAYFYPHRGLVPPELPSPWTAGALGALLLVLALCAGALWCARRCPSLAVGWFWFLGMLVPVIGLVQVGEQARADRYAYLPLVGLQIALVFAGAGALERLPRLRAPLVATLAITLVACGLASARQARTWHDSAALYSRALSVTEDNYPAWVGLANLQAEQGDTERARAGYGRALAIRPTYAPALYSLALLEQEHGDPVQAIELYRRACTAMPGLAAAHLNLGALLASRSEVVDAALEFERVLELLPDHPDAHYNLAELLLAHGQTEQALPHLEAVVRVRPEQARAWERLGDAELLLGREAEAVQAFTRALADPTQTHSASELAWILATTESADLCDPARARALARQAVQSTERRDPRALEALAAAEAALGAFARAVSVQEEALALLSPGQRARAEARLARYRKQEPASHER